MARQKFPENFTSFEEYEAYCHCLFKAKPGDQVDACFYDNEGGRFSPSPQNTPNVFRLTILGRRVLGRPENKFSSIILVGTNESRYGLWSLDDEGRDYLGRNLHTGHISEKFQYGFWHYPGEIKIKKLFVL